MAYKSPYDGPLKLELAGDPAPAPDLSIGAGNAAPATAIPAIASDMPRADRFLAEAIREFEEGRIDDPLWERAVAQAEGDKSSAKGDYLRARAAALQVIQRDNRAERAGLRKTPVSAAHHSPANSSPRQRVASGKVHPVGGKNVNDLLRSPMAILAMLISLVVVVTLVIAIWPSNSTVESTAAAGAPGGPRSGPPTRTGKSLVASNQAAINTASQDPSQDFMNTIEGLKNAGNWNVVVLQALAWTRKEPKNAAAWNELSIGYINMRQLDDAHAAARMAVEFAPKNALFWRNLGQLNLDLDNPVEALLAFEEATLLNTKDGYSFVQAGILNTRLDRLPEAKLAFTKALALNPDDANARCGVAFVAQKQERPKEVNASAKQARPVNSNCRDLIDKASAAVDLKGPTAFNVAPSPDR
jgi:tetratricopeptide (TPR) repeat protein